MNLHICLRQSNIPYSLSVVTNEQQQASWLLACKLFLSFCFVLQVIKVKRSYQLQFQAACRRGVLWKSFSADTTSHVCAWEWLPRWGWIMGEVLHNRKTLFSFLKLLKSSWRRLITDLSEACEDRLSVLRCCSELPFYVSGQYSYYSIERCHGKSP